MCLLREVALCLLAIVAVHGGDELVGFSCGSIDIRNKPGIAFVATQNNSKEQSLKRNVTDCGLVEGDFTISMITDTNYTADMFPVFRHLREITGYLLIFQVNGLDSLGRMFPNLRVIRGKTIVLHYALVVYQNTDMKEIGLTNLVEISNGGVRIADNPNLCFTSSINWKKITRSESINDILIEQNNDRCMSETQCETSPASKAGLCATVDTDEVKTACWNSTHCQKKCGCITGCVHGNATRCCSGLCLGGCSGPSGTDCELCRYVRHSGSCQRRCAAGMYLLHPFHNRCVSKAECINRAPVEDDGPVANGQHSRHYWKAVEGNCTHICPPGFMEDETDRTKCTKCVAKCPVHCYPSDTDRVSSIHDAQKLFQGCQIVEGSITVTLHDGGSMDGTIIIEELTKAMGNIVEITGHLRVSFSHSLLTLGFLKNLRVIHGRKLYSKLYAISVFENENLMSLFGNRTIEVGNGTAQFHNNPQLCYTTITGTLAAMSMNFSNLDVSPMSNGNKAICEEVNIELTVEAVLDRMILVYWKGYTATEHIDHRKFLGYQVFYRIVKGPHDKVDIHAGRDLCQDSWNMMFTAADGEEGDNMSGELIADLRPNTWYAIYVKTLVINHRAAVGGISNIVYNKTTYAMPSTPQLRDSETTATATSIQLTWDPPAQPNGDITHYIVIWTKIRETANGRIEQSCMGGAEKSLDKPTDDKKKKKKVGSGAPVDDELESSLVPPTVVALVKSKEQRRCEKEQCCACKKLPGQMTFSPEERRRRNEKTAFENQIQNRVFLQKCVGENDNSPHCKGKRRAARQLHIGATEPPKDANNVDLNRTADTLLNDSKDPDIHQRKKRSISDEPIGKNATDNNGKNATDNTMNGFTELATTDEVEEDDRSVDDSLRPKSRNISVPYINITGLHHFTDYEIKISACQNQSAEINFCSELPYWSIKRTKAIPSKDVVNVSTIVMNRTEKENKRRFSWEIPQDPNGIVLSFSINMTEKNQNQPYYPTCVTVTKLKKDGGVVLEKIPHGDWLLTISTLTLRGKSASSLPFSLHVANENAFPWWMIVLCVGALLVLSAIFGGAAIFIYKRKVKKLPDYIANMIATCPDYISTLEIYTPDEWELSREDIVLIKEIGHGSFGKVFAGRGKDDAVKSQSGVVFGDCAVKTVADTATWADRMHFLIEASVMKSFQTPFVVKLYGVVSNGQPALVVMEMMRNGNLRDYLRSCRPDAEENVDGLPPPTLQETLVWAAQIADGMAYLEAQKFCHRDLAARNCMISEYLVAKIGDFGMARDVYAKDYYRPTGKRLMPVRWMAPEALKDAKSTSKSDVWSYGVVLWELVTLAQQPYPGLGNEAVFDFVAEHRRTMERPQGCPDIFYELMQLCWKYDPRDRPTFADLVQILLPHQNDEFRATCFTCNRSADDEVHSKKREGGFFSKASAATIGKAVSKAAAANNYSPAAATPVPPTLLRVPSSDDNCASTSSASTDAIVQEEKAGEDDAAAVGDVIDSSTPLNPNGAQLASQSRHPQDPLDAPDSDNEGVSGPVCSNNRREAPRPIWNASRTKASSPPLIAGDAIQLTQLNSAPKAGSPSKTAPSVGGAVTSSHPANGHVGAATAVR